MLRRAATLLQGRTHAAMTAKHQGNPRLNRFTPYSTATSKRRASKTLKTPAEPGRPHGISTAKFNQLTSVPVALEGPYSHHSLEIHYTNDTAAVDLFVRQYLTPGTPFGFDLEHRPTYKPGQQANPSLLQFAPLVPFSSGGEAQKVYPVLLYALYHNKGRVPGSIARVLCDAGSQKYGVGIKSDLLHLAFLELGESRSSFHELGQLAYSYGRVSRPSVGLKELTTAVMGEPCTAYKTKKLTMTNWELLNLTLAQQKYAAMDAFVAIEIYKRLEEERTVDLRSSQRDLQAVEGSMLMKPW